ncbi:50S ribosomal protein L10 [candidate division NPL-UPA2 bacterium Unc8]|uniref:Large ribosomal subunit protein uL10 n=1 Tax=candidate division NPL-UPA2 bacterium Unc8 TaxID=1980939 RepID=A0A399FY60_UNCN2|nr:50S ribosomal protein L10 [Bacillota bacterium]MBT9138864.1 50S ribosomal protein L10 [Bacillota bacterium]MBT9146486.1 50S ribosomal protein L10 [Bacillota bacterium]RII00310.1 MAG: 50S ribosomal protein L10 [candidate division NPL-UPA2 bacterium Unc8]
MSRELNKIAVRELGERMEQARTIVVIDHQGVDARSLDTLRHRLRDAKADYQVVKNTIARLAVRDIGLTIFDKLLVGSNAFAFTDEEPGQLAKILLHFAGEQKRFAIKGGVFQGEMLKRERIELWATLPVRSEVLSSLIINLKAPYAGLAMTLGGIMRKLIHIIELIKEKKSSG